MPKRSGTARSGTPDLAGIGRGPLLGSGSREPGRLDGNPWKGRGALRSWRCHLQQPGRGRERPGLERWRRGQAVPVGVWSRRQGGISREQRASRADDVRTGRKGGREKKCLTRAAEERPAQAELSHSRQSPHRPAGGRIPQVAASCRWPRSTVFALFPSRERGIVCE